MAPVGLEPTTAMFERMKTVHALCRADTVMGCDETTGSVIAAKELEQESRYIFSDTLILNSYLNKKNGTPLFAAVFATRIKLSETKNKTQSESALYDRATAACQRS
jgi:hypothetical protein